MNNMPNMEIRNISDNDFYKNTFCLKYNILALKRSSCSIKCEITKFDLVSEINSYLNGVIDFHTETGFLSYTFISVNDKKYMISVESYFDINNSNTSDQRINMFSQPENILNIYNHIKNTYGHKHAIASWYFKSPNGIENKEFSIAKVKQIYPEFYPYIKQNIDLYTKEFLESTSNILILLGPPGTGKSSFIKNLITTHKCDTMITYDNDLIMSDSFYQMFIMEDSNLLIIEDADAFLVSNEKQDTILNKFLSLSDGIIDVSDKKIIFTANISKEQISPALVRPGRCYDIVEFRDLTKAEAQKVSERLNIKLIHDKDTYTLAEIINQKSNITQKTKFGFI